jgi:hypothetical protein
MYPAIFTTEYVIYVVHAPGGPSDKRRSVVIHRSAQEFVLNSQSFVDLNCSPIATDQRVTRGGRGCRDQRVVHRAAANAELNQSEN